MTIVSGGGVPGPAARIAKAQYDGRRTALDRMTAECATLGGHGVVGATVRVREIPAEIMTAAALEFTVLGTAVRALGCPPPGRPFACDLPGQDFAKLVTTGWMPVGIVLGISVAARHDHWLESDRSHWGPGNTEVPTHTDLITSVRHDARSQVEREVRSLGADGVVVTAMTVRARGDACQTHPGGTDHVAEAVITGTAVTCFSHQRSTARLESLAVLTLERLSQSFRNGGPRPMAQQLGVIGPVIPVRACGS
jgi:uncharacterized protein YbjQ (UPF0145 family)